MLLHSRHAMCVFLPLTLVLWLPTPRGSHAPNAWDTEPNAVQEAFATGDETFDLDEHLPGFDSASPLGLIENPGVQDLLELTTSQKDKLIAVADATMECRRELMEQIRQVESEQVRDELFVDARRQLQERSRDAADEIKEVLDADQWQRLTQIAIQLRGIRALFDRGVQQKLSLSSEQRWELHQLNARWRQERSQVVTGGQGRRLKLDVRESRLARLEAALEGQLLSVLSAEQRQQFADMQGDRIDRSKLGATTTTTARKN